MKSVLAWQTSCWYVFKKARQCRSKSFHWCLPQLHCHDCPLQPGVFDVERVLSLLQTWQGPTDNPCGVDQAKWTIRQACDAKVHAEAWLMQWIATVKVWLLSIYFYCCCIQLFSLGCSLYPGVAYWCQDMLPNVLAALSSFQQPAIFRICTPWHSWCLPSLASTTWASQYGLNHTSKGTARQDLHFNSSQNQLP